MFDTNKSCYDLHINMYFCNISVDLLSAKYYNTLIHIIMLSFNIYPKKLHFKQPAGTSRGIYITRNIWYLTVTDTSRPHAMGFGECSPLYDLSCDYNDDYLQTLTSLCRHTEQMGGIDYETLRDYPSILFGIETALRHLEHQDFVLWHSPTTENQQGIAINGLVWMGSHDEMMNRMIQKAHDGFRCIKIKIGAIDFEQELNIIKSVRELFDNKEIELRLDANGGFSPDEALNKLNALAKYNIHSVEQPIKQHQWYEMERICRLSPIPIALDEELIGINKSADKKSMLETIRPQYIILKPTLHGSFTGCEEWIDLAQRLDIGYWITSALESNIGLNAIAQWAAALNPVLPQGLGTGALFTDNVDMPLSIKGDSLFIDISVFPSNDALLKQLSTLTNG